MDAPVGSKDREAAPLHGRSAIPIEIFVVKIVSRCNLNCSYCYMYNLGDETWRNQPKVMSKQTYKALARRAREHIEKHKQPEVCFILHGGEPLLAGKKVIADFVETIRSELETVATVAVHMQTNGTLLDNGWIDFLDKLGIGIGISLDGPAEINDRHRKTHGGRGSSKLVEQGIRLALEHGSPEFFGSVLSVIDPTTEPLSIYRYFRSLGLRGADFLLPDATWEKPPPRPGTNSSCTPYADWLIPIFDAWFEEANPDFRIRTFETIIERVLGGTRAIDSLGGSSNQILVVETDGGLEPVDVMKVCGDGFTKLNLNVLKNSIDDIYESGLARIYLEGSKHLCNECRQCPVVAVCGGGYLPHRYNPDNEFENPSVYCADLVKLIRYIRGRVVQTLPAAVLTRMEAREAELH
ncbi:MAG TPA: FxsB family cyclophane-forming radical SAM/SPASM peptide maturase [Xanthobacteraceae bacterium]